MESVCQQKWLKYIDVTEETLTSLNRASIPVVRIWVSDGLTRASCMICLDSEARHLKQRPFSGLVNKNTGVGYSPIISVLCVNVAISKTSRTFKSVFFIRRRRSDSSIFVDKWNLASATIARSFSQRPQAAIRQLWAWPRIHVQPRFQRGFRNGVTFLRVVYDDDDDDHHHHHHHDHHHRHYHHHHHHHHHHYRHLVITIIDWTEAFEFCGHFY